MKVARYNRVDLFDHPCLKWLGSQAVWAAKADDERPRHIHWCCSAEEVLFFLSGIVYISCEIGVPQELVNIVMNSKLT